MPTKPNKAGQQQNYVPQGNGDASGEYADNVSGSNKHFEAFKKPDTQNITTKNNENRSNAFKIKYSNEKGKFKYNEYWKQWVYYTPEEYERYLKQKANAEQWGSKAYAKDIFEDRDIKIVSPEEVQKVVDESKKDMEKEIEKLDIYQLNKMTPDEIYKNSIKSVLGNDFTEEERDVFVKKNQTLLREKTSELKELIDKRKIQVSKEYIEKNFTKIKGEHSIEDDLKNTNPLYSSGNYSYHINCQRCSYAYELRRRGYDVQAFPNDDDYGRKKGSFWTRQMQSKESYSFRNSMGARKLHEKISEKVIAAGDGSRFAIEVQWRRSRSGHLFIVENVGGQVKYFDAQTGLTDCIRYLNDVATSKETTLKRMDNAEFDIGVIMTGFSPKGAQK